MFNLISEYIWLISEFEKTNDNKRINSLQKKISLFESQNLCKFILMIDQIIIDNNLSFPIWIYLQNNNKNEKNIFNNTDELMEYLNKNINRIIKTWGLNCYLISKNNKNTFFQLHYQNSIIRYTIK